MSYQFKDKKQDMVKVMDLAKELILEHYNKLENKEILKVYLGTNPLVGNENDFQKTVLTLQEGKLSIDKKELAEHYQNVVDVMHICYDPQSQDFTVTNKPLLVEYFDALSR